MSSARTAARTSSLRASQRRLAAAITGDDAAVLRARPLLRAGGPIAADLRLGIYRYAWFERLRSVLANDYPALAELLGERAFARLARAYVTAHPSRHQNLNRLGARLPAFVATRRPGRAGAFAAELAAFEGAIAAAFDADQAPSLDLAALAQQRAPARLRLRLQAGVRLFACEFPVAAWYTASREGKRPRAPRRRRTHVCVHRVGWRVSHLPLTRAQFLVLSALDRGMPLQRALGAAGRTADVGAWFREWAAAQLFAAPRR